VKQVSFALICIIFAKDRLVLASGNVIPNGLDFLSRICVQS